MNVGDIIVIEGRQFKLSDPLPEVVKPKPKPKPAPVVMPEQQIINEDYQELPQEKPRVPLFTHYEPKPAPMPQPKINQTNNLNSALYYFGFGIFIGVLLSGLFISIIYVITGRLIL